MGCCTKREIMQHLQFPLTVEWKCTCTCVCSTRVTVYTAFLRSLNAPVCECGSNSNLVSCNYEQEVNMLGQQASAIEVFTFTGALFCGDGDAVNRALMYHKHGNVLCDVHHACKVTARVPILLFPSTHTTTYPSRLCLRSNQWTFNIPVQNV